MALHIGGQLALFGAVPLFALGIEVAGLQAMRMVVSRFQRIEALRIQVDHVHLQRVMPQLLGGLRGQMGIEGAGFGMGKQDQARMGRGVQECATILAMPACPGNYAP
jgi:hypothetical protein